MVSRNDQIAAEGIRKAGRHMSKHGQVRHKLYTIGGRVCAEGAFKRTTEGRQGGLARDRTERYCVARWGMSYISANDHGLLKPHHFETIARAVGGRKGVRPQDAADRKQAKIDATLAKKQAKQSSCPAPSSEAGSSGLGLGAVMAFCGQHKLVVLLALLVGVLVFTGVFEVAIAWAFVAAAVVVVILLLRSMMDAVPQVNWGYIPVWLAHRREARTALVAKREALREEVAASRAPIALGTAAPVEIEAPDVVGLNEHIDLMNKWAFSQSVDDRYAMARNGRGSSKA